MEKGYTITEKRKLPHSKMEIEAEVSIEALLKFRTITLRRIAADAELPGFRKGHVPESMLIERLGEMHILEKTAEAAIEEFYPLLVTEQKIDAIGRPEITITKLAPGSPLSFKVKVGVVPSFALPDYKSIAKTAAKDPKEVSVRDEEIEKVISVILESRKEKDGTVPELTDALVKTFGPFETVADFKKKIKENMLKEKQLEAREKIRLEIIKKIVSKTDIDLPRVLIEGELDRMLSTFEAEAKNAGTTLDTYLVESKKTKETLRKEWEPNAEERVRVELLLGRIAESEKIAPKDEEVDADVSRLFSMHPDADKNRLHAYVRHILTNEKVLEFLESWK